MHTLCLTMFVPCWWSLHSEDLLLSKSYSSLGSQWRTTSLHTITWTSPTITCQPEPTLPTNLFPLHLAPTRAAVASFLNKHILDHCIHICSFAVLKATWGKGLCICHSYRFLSTEQAWLCLIQCLVHFFPFMDDKRGKSNSLNVDQGLLGDALYICHLN
jgi:hypothetical protein